MSHRGTGMEQLCRSAVPEAEGDDIPIHGDIHARVRGVDTIKMPKAEKGMFEGVLPVLEGTRPEPGWDGCMGTNMSCLMGRSAEQEAARAIDRGLLEATLDRVSVLMEEVSAEVCRDE